MSTTIVGLYDNEQSLNRIKSGLKDHGVSDRHVDTVTWRSLSEGNDPWGIGRSRERGESATGKLADELESRGVPSTDAREFAEAVRRGGSLLITQIDDDSKADEIARYLDKHDSVDLSSRREKWRESGYSGFNRDADLYSREEVDRERKRVLEGGEEARLQSAHEEVHVGKRDTQSGGLRVHKHVEEKPVEEEIELREEHANVERTQVDRSTSGTTGDPFTEETIEVTEHAEEPVVEKKTHIDEEIRVGKDVETRKETIRETARETVIDIDRLTEGVDEGHRFSNYQSDYRQHYKSEYGTGGHDYDAYEPAYRFGHAFGVSDRYRDRDFEEVEPDLRTSYEREHGSGTFDKFRDAARYGFNSARRRLRR